MKQTPNIFWFIVDCVRSYISGQDDRDKLDVMFELSSECVDFENMIVSAPSSIMSIACAMSSIPAYYLANNYINFKFDTTRFWCLRDILAGYGYPNFSILNAREAREMVTEFLDLVDKHYQPKNLRHYQYRWSNKDVTKVFFNILNSNPPSPAFYLVWYNSRLDAEVSQNLSGVVEELKKRDLFEDSIFIMTSDHGYPDLSRGLVSDGWDLKKVGLPHDLILTDDNIKVPFLLRYPGSKARKIKQMVGNEDILPTILDILGRPPPKEKSLPFFGKSMIPLIEEDTTSFFYNRKIRSDGRFSMQGGRITSIRSDGYKYIIRHDDQIEEFYELSKDPKELNNVILNGNSKSIINEFRQHFELDEKNALKFQEELLTQKFRSLLDERLNWLDEVTDVIILIIGKSPMCRVVYNCIRERFPSLRIHIIMPDQVKETFEWDSVDRVVSYSELEYGNNPSLNSSYLRLEVIDDPASPLFQRDYKKFNKIITKKVIRIDGNMTYKEISNHFFADPKVSRVFSILNNLIIKKDLFIKEPVYFFLEIRRLGVRLINRLIKGRNV